MDYLAYKVKFVMQILFHSKLNIFASFFFDTPTSGNNQSRCIFCDKRYFLNAKRIMNVLLYLSYLLTFFWGSFRLSHFLSRKMIIFSLMKNFFHFSIFPIYAHHTNLKNIYRKQWQKIFYIVVTSSISEEKNIFQSFTFVYFYKYNKR